MSVLTGAQEQELKNVISRMFLQAVEQKHTPQIMEEVLKSTCSQLSSYFKKNGLGAFGYKTTFTHNHEQTNSRIAWDIRLDFSKLGLARLFNKQEFHVSVLLPRDGTEYKYLVWYFEPGHGMMPFGASNEQDVIEKIIEYVTHTLYKAPLSIAHPDIRGDVLEKDVSLKFAELELKGK